jgi:hypothetical protein
MPTNPSAQSSPLASHIKALGCAALLATEATLGAAQQGTPQRLLVANQSKIAVIAPDGAIEREVKVNGLHDGALLPNGNILCQANWTKVIEVNPEGAIVWEYDAANSNGNQGVPLEIHSLQRLENGDTLIAESGPGRLIEVDPQGKLKHTIRLTLDKPSKHRDTRLVRKTAQGTYLVAHEGDGKVREYDHDGKVIWEYQMQPAGALVFSAIRLENGNTLIGSGHGKSVIEVNPRGQIVWKLSQEDLPDIKLASVTRVERLPNGNTRFGNCHAGPNMPLCIEVTPSKQVVWSYSDFERFGNYTILVDVVPPAEKAPLN